MKKFILILLCLLPFLLVRGQTMQEIKSVTAFFYTPDNTGKAFPLGTCFFIGIQSPSTPNNSYVYLVTAKHVLQNQEGSFIKRVYVRLNTKDSSSVFEPIDLITEGIHKNIFVHADSSVDIAVIGIISNADKYNLKILNETFLSNRQQFKDYNVQEGTEIFFTGLFTGYTGEKRIYPIVRFGKVALITDEKIDFTGKKRDLILIESSSFGGNSGSPVYFKMAYPNGTIGLKLAGLLNGTFRDVSQAVESTGKLTTLSIPYNNGISGITPIYHLNEILFSEELSKNRK